MNNNKVIKIAHDIGVSLPSLHTLILAGNRIAEIDDLQGLASLKSLRFLSLVDNPLTKRVDYRLRVIHLLPSLRLLDYRKVSHQVVNTCSYAFVRLCAC